MLDTSLFRTSLNQIKQKGEETKIHITKAITERGPIDGVIKTSDIAKGVPLKEHLLWAELGTASKITGTKEDIQRDCLTEGRLPPFTKETNKKITAILQAKSITHIFLKPDVELSFVFRSSNHCVLLIYFYHILDISTIHCEALPSKSGSLNARIAYKAGFRGAATL